MLSSKSILIALVYFSASSLAAPLSLHRREVPQEHSHEPFITSVRASLNLNNPDAIVDPIFGLLGDAAATAGLGKITDPDCLQQATADQAFTNAKAAGDVQSMVDALIFRALERNTGAVGLASVLCTSITAVNPEIAALTQHQDPASTGAAATNKAIVLELAKQIAAVGGNPQDALKSGTFAPGTIGDPTAAGHTCDDANDPNGCIFTQNLLVDDATAAEIDAAVSGISGAAADATSAADSSSATTVVDDSSATATECPAAITVTVTADANAVATTSAADATATAVATIVATTSAADATGTAVATIVATTSAADATATAVATIVATASAAAATSSDADASSTASGSDNLQTFTGALGGISAPGVTTGGRNFVVEGEPAGDDFLNLAAALGRSCDVQHNACANFANSAAGRAQGLTVGQCDTQDTQCKAA